MTTDPITRAHEASMRLRGGPPRQGDRWETRCVLVASNEWPAPVAWMPGLIAIDELVTPEQARWFKFEWERSHWPPPAKGTHEWDLDFVWPSQGDPVSGEIAIGSSLAGRTWSHSA